MAVGELSSAILVIRLKTQRSSGVSGRSPASLSGSVASAHSDVLILMEIRATHQSVYNEHLTWYKMSPFL